MMQDFDKNMSEVFDVPFEEVKKEANTSMITMKEPKEEGNTTSSFENDLPGDYETVRDNYNYIVTKGMNAINDIIDVAKNSQEPRAYEVAAILIKNVTDANEKLILLQKQMRDMTGKSKATNETNIDKAVFIGSPSDLNKLLKGNIE